MKCIVFLALLASSQAFSLYGGYGTQREIRVNGDRRIFIRGSNKMVVFNVPRDDPKSIDIVVRDQDGTMKIIKINNDKQIIKQISLVPRSGMEGMFFDERDTETRDNKHSSSTSETEVGNHQMNTLINIFKKYEGIVDEAKFYQLLKEVKQYVERRELHPVIYDVISELEVAPIQRDYLDERDVEINKPVVKDDARQTQLGDEAAKLRDFRDANVEQRHTETPTDNTLDQRAKVTQALQAAHQIQWIQSILENKRNHFGDNHNIHNNLISRQGDLPRDSDLFIKSTLENHRGAEGELKELVLQINIQELQGDIIQEQLKAQQLQIQQQFLNGQRQQLKLHQQVGQHQGLHATQMQDLREAYDKVKKLEEQLMEEQLQIQKTIHKLQDRLVKLHEELRDHLRKEANREIIRY